MMRTVKTYAPVLFGAMCGVNFGNALGFAFYWLAGCINADTASMIMQVSILNCFFALIAYAIVACST